MLLNVWEREKRKKGEESLGDYGTILETVKY